MAHPVAGLKYFFLCTFNVNFKQVNGHYLHLIHERRHCDRTNFDARTLMSYKCPFPTSTCGWIRLTDTNLSVSIPKSRMNRSNRWIGVNVPGEYGEVRTLRFYRNHPRSGVSVGEVYGCHSDVSSDVHNCSRRKRQIKVIFPPQEDFTICWYVRSPYADVHRVSNAWRLRGD